MTKCLDLFADFAVSGEILGVGLGSRPDDWASALGSDFFEASWNRGHLVRQFGFVDANFREDSAGWSCDYINIQVRQLCRLENPVPRVLKARYGEFPGRVPFDEVAELMAGAGIEIYHVARIHLAELEQYWIPQGKVMFSLISDYQATDLPPLRIGDVYSVTTTAGLDLAGDLLTRYR